MTQFKRSATQLDDLSKVPSEGTNITIPKCRVIIVDDIKVYRKDGVEKKLFNVVIADRHGIADLTVYDGGKHAMFESLTSRIVRITGLCASTKAETSRHYSYSIGANYLWSAGMVKAELLDVVDTSIPTGNDDFPIKDTWLNPTRETASIRTPSAGRTPPRMMLQLECALGCSNPTGPICRKSGHPHVRPQVCSICHLNIVPGEEFCSDPSRLGKPCIPFGEHPERKDTKRGRDSPSLDGTHPEMDK